jgi:hypothetical protein
MDEASDVMILLFASPDTNRFVIKAANFWNAILL